MSITKEQIVNDMLAADFELDGHTDYTRVVEFCKAEYKVALTNKAVWALVNALKQQGLDTLDFD